MFQTVDQVVGSIMLEMRLTADQRIYVRNYVINFLYEFRNHTKALLALQSIATIPQSLTIPFPDDYIKKSAVFFVVDGQMHLLGENKNIAVNPTLSQRGIFTGVQQAAYLSPTGAPVPNNLSQYGYGLGINGPLAATGTVSGAIIPELKGFYREDTENRVFRLSTTVQIPNWNLSYESDCFEDSDRYAIHPHSYLCCKQYVKWSMKKDALKPVAWEVDVEALSLDNEMIKMKRLFSEMSVFDIISSYDQWLGPNV